MRVSALIVVSCLACNLAAVRGATVFSDDFNAGASALWSNTRGNWTDAGGVYEAGISNNIPPTYSALPYNLTDFSIDVDINDISDGGIWLRSSFSGSASGILLVTGGLNQTGTGLYWHIVNNDSYSPILNSVSGLFTQGDEIHLRVVAIGNTYSAYLNGSSTAATTLTDASFAAGNVGLYDYNDAQTFDNVVVSTVPTPGALMAGLPMCGGLLLMSYRRRFQSTVAA